MKWDLVKLQAKSADERHDLWLNAKRLADSNEDAKELVTLIENSGLDYKAGKRQSISIYGKIGKRMREIIFSPAGEQAALQAHADQLPPLAGVDPLLKEALGFEYGRDNEATVQAGFLVTDLMRQLGYELSGKSKKLPETCVAKTGQIFEKRG